MGSLVNDQDELSEQAVMRSLGVSNPHTGAGSVFLAAPHWRALTDEDRCGRRHEIGTVATDDPCVLCLGKVGDVVHCGESMAGSFASTLVLTDIASGWLECIALLVREGSLIVDALERLRATLRSQ